MQNKQIAQNIKSKCKEKGISVSSLLSSCSINPIFVYELEKRDKIPKIDTLIKIADCLDCSIDYLVGRTDNPDSHKL